MEGEQNDVTGAMVQGPQRAVVRVLQCLQRRQEGSAQADVGIDLDPMPPGDLHGTDEVLGAVALVDAVAQLPRVSSPISIASARPDGWLSRSSAIVSSVTYSERVSSRKRPTCRRAASA